MSGFSAINYALSKKLDSAILTGVASHSVDNVNKTITFSFNDGTSSTIKFNNPTNGVGIASMHKDSNNHLIVSLTDGSTIDVGELPIADVSDKNIKTYTSLSQLGLTQGSETLLDIAKKMSDNSMFILNVHSSCNLSEYPLNYGVLTINKSNINRVSFIFTETGSGITLRQWFASYNKGKLNGWKRVCTTTVEDVEETLIEIDNIALGLGVTANHSKYKVINGICYVTIEINVKAPSENMSFRYKKINATSLPKIGFNTKAILNVIDGDNCMSLVLEKGSTDIKLHGNIVGKDDSYIIQGSFSYPVVE